jgi:hypothetical protein
MEGPEDGPAGGVGLVETVTPVLSGRCVRNDDTWAYQGTPQEGSLLVGFDPQAGRFSGRWVDTWHMGRAVMACVGDPRTDGRVAVTGSYPALPGLVWA